MEEEIVMKVEAKGDTEQGDCWDERGLGLITTLYIFHETEKYINSIQVAYKQDPSDRCAKLSARHGGGYGDNFDVIQLSANERIVCVSGWCDRSDNKIKSLTITIKNAESGECKTFGPFGEKSYGYFGPKRDTRFSFRMGCDMFGGFHGYSDDRHLHAISVYVKTSATQMDEKCKKSSMVASCDMFGGFDGYPDDRYLRAIGVYVKTSATQMDEKCKKSSMVATGKESIESVEEVVMKIGPRGDTNGYCWDEGGLGLVSTIYIFHDDNINSIQVAYKQDPSDRYAKLSASRGAQYGRYFDVIQLSAVESIVCVSGCYDRISGQKNKIRSLTITIKNAESGECKTFGPFGEESGTRFSFRMDCGMFCGFHGYYDRKCLRAIGVYVKTAATQMEEMSE